MSDGSWWIYDRRLLRDGLFVVSVMCGVAAAIAAVVSGEDASVLVCLYDVLGGAASEFLLGTMSAVLYGTSSVAIEKEAAGSQRTGVTAVVRT
jgi:hypothetical protein